MRSQARRFANASTAAGVWIDISECRRRFSEADHNRHVVAVAVRGCDIAQWGEAIDVLKRGAPLDDDPEFLSGLGFSYAKLGNRAEAKKYLAKLRELGAERYVSPASVGLVHLALGDRKSALEFFERGYEDHSWWMIFLKVDPRFEDIRGDPAFRALMGRVGLN